MHFRHSHSGIPVEAHADPCYRDGLHEMRPLHLLPRSTINVHQVCKSGGEPDLGDTRWCACDSCANEVEYRPRQWKALIGAKGPQRRYIYAMPPLAPFSGACPTKASAIPAVSTTTGNETAVTMTITAHVPIDVNNVQKPRLARPCTRCIVAYMDITFNF